MVPTIYCSPVDCCDICHAPFDKVMIDAKVLGAWGNVCEPCFDSDPKARLGLGYGQRYELIALEMGKAWVLVKGGMTREELKE